MKSLSWSRVISCLFHPLFIPVAVLIVLLTSTIYSNLLATGFILTLILVTLLITILLPVSVTLLLIRLRVIGSLFMEQREERIYPILSAAIFYYVTYYLYRGIHATSIFSYFMLGATMVSIATLVINFYSKISLHMTGLGSFTGLFIGLAIQFGLDLNVEIVIGILLSGIVGAARLKMNAHRPAEIYSGFLLGVVIMTGLILML